MARTRCRHLAIAATLGATLGLTGCDLGAVFDGSEDGPTRTGISSNHRDPGTLIVGRAGDASSLEPGRASDNESIEVMEQIYDKLVHFRPGTNELEPGLAVSWETSEQGRVWTFKLRPGVTFHDGSRLDADAVVFSFERQRDPRHPAHRADFLDWRNTFSYVQKVEKVADDQVRITIERMYAPFLSYLAMTAVAIVPPHAVMEQGPEFASRPVGTGPFELVEWQRGRRIVLERNERYWGERAAVERLIFEALPDPRQRIVALESGAIDIAYGVPPREVRFIELHPGLRVHETAANNVSYVAMNTQRAPWTDVRVRRAVNYAVNVDPIVKLVFQGMATPAKGPMPPSQWGYHEPRAVYGYDPERARALLEEARADGAFDPRETYAFYVLNAPRPYFSDPLTIARVIRANLRAVGIKTRAVEAPLDEFLAAARNGKHDLCLIGWVPDTQDPDNYLYVMFSRDNAVKGTANNLAFFRDEEVHGLLVFARESNDREEREQLYARVQELIGEQAPWVPLAHSRHVVAARADVAGMVINPLGHVAYRRVRRADTRTAARARAAPDSPATAGGGDGPAR